MTVWSPRQYAKYSDERARPIIDLLARVPLTSAKIIYDLGCGAGAAFQPLRKRFPDAQIVGLDNNIDMLKGAEVSGDAAKLLKADIATWRPDRPADMLFSNAALHWLAGHDELLPRLIGMLRPGGILAVQMPVTWVEPVHTLLRAMALEAPWQKHIDPELRPYPLLEADQYAKILAPRSAALDIWETRYLHRLSGNNPVFEWIKGTSLRPILAQLPETLADEFARVYAEALSSAYPRADDGMTYFFMRRRFIVAIAG